MASKESIQHKIQKEKEKHKQEEQEEQSDTNKNKTKILHHPHNHKRSHRKQPGFLRLQQDFQIFVKWKMIGGPMLSPISIQRSSPPHSICVASRSMSSQVIGVTTLILRRKERHLSPPLPPRTTALVQAALVQTLAQAHLKTTMWRMPLLHLMVRLVLMVIIPHIH